jgi:signal transduction histidine kinase
LIGSLADERFQLKQLISDTQKEKTSAEQLKAELAIQLDSIRQQNDRLINDERDKIAREIHLLHQQIKDTSTQLKADRSHQL